MPLLLPILEAGIVGAFASGIANGTRRVVATAFAAAFISYFTPSQNCAVQPASNVTPRATELTDAFVAEFEKNPSTQLEAADNWASVIDLFVLPTTFGVSGLIVSTLGASSLSKLLVAEFIKGSGGSPSPTVASGIAKAIDVWTRGTITKDTLLPVPPGCTGPII